MPLIRWSDWATSIKYAAIVGVGVRQDLALSAKVGFFIVIGLYFMIATLEKKMFF